MLIFLGDSQLVGYELGDEIGQGLEYVPESVLANVKYSHMLPPPCRPDLSYPELLSKKLNMDYVNLGLGGSSHIRQYHVFQKYIRSNDLPDNVTVFLNTTDKHRGMAIDVLDGMAANYMPFQGGYWGVAYEERPTSLEEDKANHFLQFIKNSHQDVSDALFRIFPWINVQMVNHIADICNAKNWNFLYHTTNQPLWPSDFHQPEESYFTLTDDQILEDDYSVINPEYWLDFHLSTKGHIKTTELLYDRYMKCFA